MSAHTDELAAQRGHLLTITKHADWHEDEPYWDWEITCLALSLCNGFTECLDPHAVDGKAADDGPYDGDLGVPWCDEDEFEFHGVLHTWRYGHGWTVPYTGCIVQFAEDISDSVYEIARDHGIGTHVVDDEWDDSSCWLIHVSQLPGVKS